MLVSHDFGRQHSVCRCAPMSTNRASRDSVSGYRLPCRAARVAEADIRLLRRRRSWRLAPSDVVRRLDRSGQVIRHRSLERGRTVERRRRSRESRKVQRRLAPGVPARGDVDLFPSKPELPRPDPVEDACARSGAPTIDTSDGSSRRRRVLPRRHDSRPSTSSEPVAPDRSGRSLCDREEARPKLYAPARMPARPAGCR